MKLNLQKCNETMYDLHSKEKFDLEFLDELRIQNGIETVIHDKKYTCTIILGYLFDQEDLENAIRNCAMLIGSPVEWIEK